MLISRGPKRRTRTPNNPRTPGAFAPEVGRYPPTPGLIRGWFSVGFPFLIGTLTTCGQAENWTRIELAWKIKPGPPSVRIRFALCKRLAYLFRLGNYPQELGIMQLWHFFGNEKSPWWKIREMFFFQFLIFFMESLFPYFFLWIHFSISYHCGFFKIFSILRILFIFFSIFF